MAAAPEHQQQHDRSRRPINPHIETSALGRKCYDYSTRSIRIFRVLFRTYASLTPWSRRYTKLSNKTNELEENQNGSRMRTGHGCNLGNRLGDRLCAG